MGQKTVYYCDQCGLEDYDEDRFWIMDLATHNVLMSIKNPMSCGSMSGKIDKGIPRGQFCSAACCEKAVETFRDAMIAEIRSREKRMI